VCILVGRGGAILWADASTSPAALPDSRARWEAMWRHRDELAAIVHSHPLGPAAFSAEDESTMAAVDSALGKNCTYCVVTPRVTISRTGPTTETIEDPWWAGLVRLASGIPQGE
jgi:hypothetical protein